MFQNAFLYQSVTTMFYLTKATIRIVTTKYGLTVVLKKKDREFLFPVLLYGKIHPYKQYPLPNGSHYLFLMEVLRTGKEKEHSEWSAPLSQLKHVYMKCGFVSPSRREQGQYTPIVSSCQVFFETFYKEKEESPIKVTPPSLWNTKTTVTLAIWNYRWQGHYNPSPPFSQDISGSFLRKLKRSLPLGNDLFNCIDMSMPLIVGKAIITNFTIHVNRKKKRNHLFSGSSSSMFPIICTWLNPYILLWNGIASELYIHIPILSREKLKKGRDPFESLPQSLTTYETTKS